MRSLHSTSSSTRADAFIDFLCRFLAWNETNQDALDRIKLGSVDERIGADIEKCDERDSIVDAFNELGVAVEEQNHVVYSDGHPRDDVKSTYKDHGLDDVGLNVM